MHKIIDGPFVWKGSDIVNSTDWILPLDARSIDILETGLSKFEAQGLNWQQASKDTFSLEQLDTFFRHISDELENGFGLIKITGLPVERYSDAQLKSIYYAMMSHIGVPVSQNTSGAVMMAIEDEGKKKSESYGTVQDAKTGEKFLSSRSRALSGGVLRLHTDRCDVVTLLCVRQATSGGISKLVSAVAIHNEMLKRRPDLLELLFQDYPRSRFGEESKDIDGYFMLPIFGMCKGKFTTHFSRTYIEASQTGTTAPRMSDKQWEAMDLLAQLGEELGFTMALEPGDIQLLNNHHIFHGRTAYEDTAELGSGRLLHRIWMAVPNSRQLPAGQEVLWGTTASGKIRGGIWPKSGINP